MTPLKGLVCPSYKVNGVSEFLVKVTVVAGEPVEVQVRVEAEDPGVRPVMVGTAGGQY